MTTQPDRIPAHRSPVRLRRFHLLSEEGPDLICEFLDEAVPIDMWDITRCQVCDELGWTCACSGTKEEA